MIVYAVGICANYEPDEIVKMFKEKSEAMYYCLTQVGTFSERRDYDGYVVYYRGRGEDWYVKEYWVE